MLFAVPFIFPFHFFRWIYNKLCHKLVFCRRFFLAVDLVMNIWSAWKCCWFAGAEVRELSHHPRSECGGGALGNWPAGDGLHDSLQEGWGNALAPEGVPKRLVSSKLGSSSRKRAVVLESGAVFLGSGAVVLESRGVVLESGAVVLEDRAVVLGNGAVVLESGAVVLESRGVVLESGAVVLESRGSSSRKQGSSFWKRGSSSWKQGQ